MKTFWKNWVKQIRRIKLTRMREGGNPRSCRFISECYITRGLKRMDSRLKDRGNDDQGGKSAGMRTEGVSRLEWRTEGASRRRG